MTKTSDTLKLAKLAAKERQKDRMYGLAQSVVRSPLAQIMGTVATAEILENAGILSGRWAGAVEGGVIAMVGLQALKDYGIVGATTLGLGISAGSMVGDLMSEDDPVKYAAKDALLMHLGTALKSLGVMD